MPRYYNSLAEAQAGVRGWGARNALAAAKRGARRAALEDPQAIADAAARRGIIEENRLSRDLVIADEKVTALESRLTAARARAGRLADLAYQSGDLGADSLKVKAQINGLPALIQRARHEAETARDALARHRTMMAEHRAAMDREAAPVTISSEINSDPVDEVEPQPEPVPEAPRGRGRPRKVLA